MIKEPRFWRGTSAVDRALSLAFAPAAALYDAGQNMRRTLAREARAAAPVFCVGATTLGGVGKTPFALLIAEHLRALGAAPMFLTRGYGGRERGPHRVDPKADDMRRVGDEALLLAAAAPTVVARRRPAGAGLAAQAGAGAVVMDDGYQNPSLRKDCGFLLINGRDPVGNGRVFPAGPLREPLPHALSRADAVVIIDPPLARPDLLSSFAGLVLDAHVAPDAPPAPRRVIAFAGVGAPERFFGLLQSLGFDVVARCAFPDHHPYTPEEISTLRADAARERAQLITTAKDFVRLGAEARQGVLVLNIALRIDAPAQLDALLAQTLAGFAGRRDAGGAAP